MNISLKDIIKNNTMFNEINKEPVEIIDNKFQIENEEYEIFIKKINCNKDIISMKFARIIDNKPIYTYYKSKYPAVVMNTIKEYFINLLNNDVIIFTGNNKEPKRVKRYKTMLEYITLKYSHFNLFVKDLKDETLFIVYKNNINLDDYNCEELNYLKEIK